MGAVLLVLVAITSLQVDHSHAHVHSPEGLAGLCRDSAAGGLIDAAGRDMLAGVLNVEDRVAREIMTPRRRLVTVDSEANVGDALAVLVDSPHSRFPVTDEGDEITGMVTLEDALEQVLGEVQDEFDQEEPPIAVEGSRVTVRGDLLVEVLNDRFDLSLDPGRVDTVGGWVWQELGRMPEVGDQIAIDDGIVLRVDEMEGRGVGRASFEVPGGDA